MAFPPVSTTTVYTIRHHKCYWFAKLEVSFYAFVSMIRDTLKSGSKFSFHEASGEWLKLVISVNLYKDMIKEKMLYIYDSYRILYIYCK